MELKNILFCWTFFMMCTQICECTFDINRHQIQYIADHMSEEECTELLKELSRRKIKLKQQKPLDSERKKRKVEKSENEDRVETISETLPPSCIKELLIWNAKDGKGHTFYGLAASLERIKRPDLAHKLSKMVYKEKADAVKRTFLNDPFAKEIHTGSPLLVESPTVIPTPHYTEPSAWKSYHTSSAIFTIVFIIGTITCCIRRCCPKCCVYCDKAGVAIRSGYYKHIVGFDIPSLEKSHSLVSLKKQSKISVKKQSQGSLKEENESLLTRESHVPLDDDIIPGTNNMPVAPSESPEASYDESKPLGLDV